MKLMLSLSPSSGEPIYKQLIEQVERMIASGQLKNGEYLPSVRELASELAVNPMTISKAYGYLENNQQVERVRGKGMQVKANVRPASMDERLTLLTPILEALCQQSEQLEISKAQALAWLDKQWKQ